MQVVALVPMRHSSERVPGKNFRLLGDRPLFAHIADTLLSCRAVSQVVIDTDSPTIMEIALERYGSSVTLLDREPGLRGGEVSMNNVILSDAYRVQSDVYLQTHSTNPLLRAETIETAIEEFRRDAVHDALFGVTELRTRLYFPNGSPLNHDPTELLRTQDLSPLYEENSSLYIFTHETLASTRRRTGSNPMMFPIDPIEAWDIDSESDFRIAEAIWHAARDRQP